MSARSRRRASLAVFVTLAGVLGGKSQASAQTRPVPALPADAERAPTRPGGWEYVVGLGLGWDSNIDFLVPEGPSDASLIPRGAVGRAFTGPHRHLRLTAAGRFAGYRERSELRRGDAETGFEAGGRTASGTLWRAGGSYGLGDSASSRILVDQGASLPRVRTRSVVASAGMTRRAGARTSVRADARYFSAAFGAPGLIDGRSLRGTLGGERQISGRTAAAAEYSLEEVFAAGGPRPYVTHFASLQCTRALSPRSGILLEGGASYTPDAARAGLERKETFFGGGSFLRKVRRSSVSLLVRREVTPAFGLGFSRTDLRAGLSATVPLGRAWLLRSFATHLAPENTALGPRVVASGDDALVSVSRRLGRGAEISGEARYRRVGATARFAPIESMQAAVFVTLRRAGDDDLGLR
jgi:hypothetical protein